MSKTVGITREQIAAADKAKARATKYTPKVVLDAFLPERLAAGDIPLCEINIDHYLAMQLVCPGMMQESDSKKFDVLEIMRALFIVTQDQDLTEELLGIREKDVITGAVIFPQFDRAVKLLARELKPHVLIEVGAKLDAAFVASMKPAVPYGVSKRTDPDSPFPEARTQAPGSAGSSPS